MRIRSIAILSALLFITLLAATAQAQQPTYPAEEERDNYLTGYYARNFGGDLFEDRSPTHGIGAAFTFWGRGLLSAEIDLGYNPDFLSDGGDNSNLFTATLSGIVGPWIQAGSHWVRPYGVFGGGLMRSKIGEFRILGADPRNRGILDLGGGVLFIANNRLGFRGEIRYFQGVGEKENEDGWGLLDHWNYLRGSIGAVVAF